ncbi:MAG: PSD1 domain-containing protein [Planctomycetes bacterium]|nr:PSD1 domain-containing protein [Planctomycetota bacterium]
MFRNLWFCSLLLLPVQAAAAEPSAADLDFFEAKVRPLLVKHCYECHSVKSKAVKGGLMLDSHAGVIKGGDTGAALVLGKPDDSLLVAAIRYQSFEMPPTGKLPQRDIDTLVKWVELGAPWPKEQVVQSQPGNTYDWAKVREEHWAWRPIGKPHPPQVKGASWVRNPIDRFILARLEAKEMQPASPAGRRSLIRRAYYDLIGLPPTPKEVDAFVNNPSKNAYAELIDRLLDSQHYGERWGRHWLDVARYSDGFGGFLDNKPSPHAWRYRDWVVKALNADTPYDQFVRLQIAGDLIDASRHGAATGFFALGPTYTSDGGDPDSKAQARSETLDDRVDTLSRGFLALTVSCARCHDHKFDPIPTLDYYSLAGVFNNTKKNDNLQVIPWDAAVRYEQTQKAIKVLEARVKKLQEEAAQARRSLTNEESQRIAAWQKELEQHKKTAPPARFPVHALAESGSADMKVALRGNMRKPGPVAPRRFLRLIAGEEPARFTKGSGRLELADAVASADNPLTARVIVNRIWMHHFGKALVRSPSNFGKLGQKPTHPKLLDWLARHLIDSAWSIKQMHRTIMLSATYCMSSGMDESNFNLDGDNEFVWRMNPRRLDVEAWRDGLLSVTGELDKQIGGPPVEDLAGSKRRTLYAKTSRNGDRFRSDEFLRLFDFPLPRATIAKRPVSIVPQQFLFLMNSQFMINRAKALMSRLHNEAKTDSERIERAYRLLYGRAPREREKALGLEFLAGKNVEEADAKSTPPPAEKQQPRLSQWEQYAQVLLSANEFMQIR